MEEKDIQTNPVNTNNIIKEKKHSRPFLMLIIGGIIGFLITVVLYNLPQDDGGRVAEKPTDISQPLEAKTNVSVDVFREYTTLRLKNYQNIETGSISEGMTYDSEGSGKELIPGIITYRTKALNSDDAIYMYILDKINVQNDEQEKYFLEAYEDIKNRNTSASWLGNVKYSTNVLGGSGKPWAFFTTIAGTPWSNFLTEIENVFYPNTDYIFSVLSLAHGHELSSADDESGNYNLSVFAIKGNTIIEIVSYGNLIKDLGLSQEDHTRCSEMPPTDKQGDWLTYNVECLMNIYQSGKYDTQLKNQASKLTSMFELEE